MNGIVGELQKEALDSNVRVPDLLRKAFLVARKLRVQDIETWILSELNGYAGATIPAYRQVAGEINILDPYRGRWVPVFFPENAAKLHRQLTNRSCKQPIAEIESLLSKSESAQLAMPYDPDVQAMLIREADLPAPPILLVPDGRVHGILDAVRTTILDWALKLEEEGILGENLSFSDADRQAATHVTFNIAEMSHSQIQANTHDSKQLILEKSIDPARILEFVEKVRGDLKLIDLTPNSAKELEKELATLESQAKSPRPKDTIIRDALRSVRTILEGAAGSAAGAAILSVLRSLF